MSKLLGSGFNKVQMPQTVERVEKQEWWMERSELVPLLPTHVLPDFWKKAPIRLRDVLSSHAPLTHRERIPQKCRRDLCGRTAELGWVLSLPGQSHADLGRESTIHSK